MSAAELLEGTSCVVDGRAGRETIRIGRLLARGAHGRVHLGLGEGGAVRALKLSLLPEPRRTVEVGIEASIAAQLDHENVVRFVGRGVAGSTGEPVLAFERVHENPLLVLSRPGLRGRLASDPGTRFHPLPLLTALALVADLLRGLEHLHRRSFVHHDVKLANLMVRTSTADDQPEVALLEQVLAGDARGVLVDLGATRSAAFLTELERGLGGGELAPPQLTPLYAPPEALAARPRFHGSLDVYAAALVLYACASGRAPYDHLGDPDELAALLRLKAAEGRGEVVAVSLDALAAREGTRAAAGDLHGFLVACLHRRPDERPTPGEARRHVEALLRALGGPPGRRYG